MRLYIETFSTYGVEGHWLPKIHTLIGILSRPYLSPVNATKPQRADCDALLVFRKTYHTFNRPRHSSWTAKRYELHRWMAKIIPFDE